MPDSTERRITGAIAHGSRTYGPGDEAAFAEIVGTASIDRLVAKGKLAGDWGRSAVSTSAAQPVPKKPAGSVSKTKAEKPAAE